MKRFDPILSLIIFAQFAVFALLNGFGVLSTDDIYTIHTTSLPLGEVFNQAINHEQQAPLYFLFMKIWRGLSDSLWWAKVFNYPVIALSTFLFYKILGFWVHNKNQRYIILFFFAFHPFIFFISNDLRRYTLTLLFGLICTYYVFKIYLNDKGKLADHILLVTFAVLGVLNDYYHSFLLAALGVGVLLSKNRLRWVYFAEMLIPFAVFLWLLQFILFQLESSENWDIVVIETNLHLNALKHVLFLIESQTYPITIAGISSNVKMILRLLFVVPLAFLVVTNHKLFKQPKDTGITLTAIIIFLVLVYFAVIYVLKSIGYLHGRYMSFSFPLLFLFLSLLVIKTQKNSTYKNIFAYYFFLIFVFIYSLNYISIYNKKNLYFENIKNISTVAHEYLQKQNVFVFNPKYSEMINYYINDPRRKVKGIPGELDLETYNYHVRFIQSEDQLSDLINKYIHSPEEEFYIFIANYDLIKSSYNVSILLEYQTGHLTLISEEKLYDFKIFRHTGHFN